MSIIIRSSLTSTFSYSTFNSKRSRIHKRIMRFCAMLLLRSDTCLSADKMNRIIGEYPCRNKSPRSPHILRPVSVDRLLHSCHLTTASEHLDCRTISILLLFVSSHRIQSLFNPNGGGGCIHLFIINRSEMA